eukprot:GHVR01172577.1.p1 GENE.GHVR01172577.1~~GHVR01172577.1.p1  ORF type:complete len:337 (+),score=59.79 GHVR01172577.1:90-1100(+)
MKQRSWCHWGFLVCSLIGLSPTSVMLLFILVLKEAAIAMIVMHIVCMGTLPFLFVFLRYRDHMSYRSYYVNFFKHQIKHFKQQVPIGLFLFLLSSVGGSLSYILFSCDKGILGIFFSTGIFSNIKLCIGLKEASLPLYGLSYSTGVMVFLGLYFIIVNPIVEEYFWRVFLFRELALPPEEGPFFKCPCASALETERSSLTDHARGEMDTDAPGETDAETGGEIEEEKRVSARECRSWSVDDEGIGTNLLMDQNASEVGVCVSSTLYGLYHIIIVFCLLDRLLIATAAAIGLVCMGRLWVYFRNNRKFGLTSAILMHCGIDVAVVFAFADVFFKFRR